MGRRPDGGAAGTGVDGVEKAAVLSRVLDDVGGAVADAAAREAASGAGAAERGAATGAPAPDEIDVRGGGRSGAPNDGTAPTGGGVRDAPVAPSPPGPGVTRNAASEVPDAWLGVMREVKGGVRRLTPVPPPAPPAPGAPPASPIRADAAPPLPMRVPAGPPRAATEAESGGSARGPGALKSSAQRTLSPTGMMPPQVEQRARRATLVIFAGSRRKTVWQLGQETFIGTRWRPATPTRPESPRIPTRDPGGGPRHRPTPGDSSRTPSSRWQVRSPGMEL